MTIDKQAAQAALDNLNAVVDISKSEGTFMAFVAAHEHTLRQALEAQMAGGWQPIETAPKDGTEILVASVYPDGSISVVVNVRWAESNDESRYCFWSGLDGAMGQGDVKLWMPVPAAPEVVKP